MTARKSGFSRPPPRNLPELSTSDVSEDITQQFNTFFDQITPIDVQNDLQAKQKILSIVARYESSNDWNVHFDCISEAMSLLKGNAGDSITFRQKLVNLRPLLENSIISLRSTLVKIACQFVAQIARQLSTFSKDIVEPLIPILFQSSASTTRAISDPCRHAIFQIVEYCQVPSIINTIALKRNSKTTTHRIIVTQVFVLALQKWNTQTISKCGRMMMEALPILKADASPEVRSNAQKGIDLFKMALPQFQISAPEPIKKPKRSASVQPQRKPQQISFLESLREKLLYGLEAEIQENAENNAQQLTKFIDPRSSDCQTAVSLLTDVFPLIAPSFDLDLLISSVLILKPTSASRKALSAIAKYGDPQNTFSFALSKPVNGELFLFLYEIISQHQQMIFDDPNKTKSLLELVRAHLDLPKADEILRFIDKPALPMPVISVETPRQKRDPLTPTVQVSETVHHKPPKSKTSRQEPIKPKLQIEETPIINFNELPTKPETARRKGPLCPQNTLTQTPIFEIEDRKPAQTPKQQSEQNWSVQRPQRKISSHIIEDEPPKPKPIQKVRSRSIERSFSRVPAGSNKMLSPMPQLLQSLDTLKNKAPILAKIQERVEETQGFEYMDILPHLVDLWHSSFDFEVEHLLATISSFVDRPSMIEALLPRINSAPGLEMIIRLLKTCSVGECNNVSSPIIQRIGPPLSNQQAEIRKSAIMLVVEMRLKIGPSFEETIRTLPPLSRKLVNYYVQKGQ